MRSLGDIAKIHIFPGKLILIVIIILSLKANSNKIKENSTDRTCMFKLFMQK